MRSDYTYFSSTSFSPNFSFQVTSSVFKQPPTRRDRNRLSHPHLGCLLGLIALKMEVFWSSVLNLAQIILGGWHKIPLQHYSLLVSINRSRSFIVKIIFAGVVWVDDGVSRMRWLRVHSLICINSIELHRVLGFSVILIHLLGQLLAFSALV